MSSLPTLDKLNASPPSPNEAEVIAKAWFESFNSAMKSGGVEKVLATFLNDPSICDPYWRDLLAFTWDFRTFEGLPRIEVFLRDCLPRSNPRRFELTAGTAQLQQPYPDLAWIQAFFTFDCDAGRCTGIFRIVPVGPDGVWKAHAMFTVLESLHGFPERVGRNRDSEFSEGQWTDNRAKEASFRDENPTVLIVGGGQSGLGVAARLKALNVSTLLVESTPRIGDVWRNRYDALSLHDPVWCQHLPYLSFPSTWPVFTPAPKLADWFESYAQSLDLNVWTSTTVIKARQEGETKRWNVTLQKNDGSERVLRVKHLVFTAGYGVPKMPTIPGIHAFRGETLHSSEHKTAAANKGKRVVVVGACASGHDICADHARHGIDVTMVQRGPTYIISAKRGVPLLVGDLYNENGPATEVADHIGASYPNHPSRPLQVRKTKAISEVDTILIQGLKKAGFKVSEGGFEGAGLLPLIWNRAGGYYLDMGASAMIIEGSIKVKNDSQILRVTAKGLLFEDGSELAADVLVFATGYGDNIQRIADICGDDVANSCKPLWGLDDDGELSGAWKYIGMEGLWYCTGTLSGCRYYSKQLAIQIKAIEEGLFGERYGS